MTIVSVADHEWVSALENPYTMQNRPPQPVSVPSMSIDGRSGRPSLTSRTSPPSAAGTANARLTNRL